MHKQAFALFSAAFLVSTMSMTNTEVGQFIKLLCMQHQEGHLSDRDVLIALGITSIDDASRVLERFERDEFGFYYVESADYDAKPVIDTKSDYYKKTGPAQLHHAL